MSLENKIEALTHAVIALTAAIERPTPAEVGVVTAAFKAEVDAIKAASVTSVTDVVAKAPKAPKPSAAPAAVGSPPSEIADASPASGRKGTPPAPEYAEVREALLKLNDTHGRELALAALSRLGVKSAKELAPEQYRKAIDLFVLATENGSV